MATMARVEARLVLEVDGVAHEARIYEDAPIGLSSLEWVHKLRLPGGRWWSVYPRKTHDFKSETYCERCRRCDCRHVQALTAVDLIYRLI